MLQPSSYYSPPAPPWRALRELRMETNGLATAKPSATAATADCDCASKRAFRMGKEQDAGPRELRCISKE